MSVLERNLLLLGQRYPNLTDTVRATYHTDSAFQIVETASGAPTAKIGGQLLHSGYDPYREARKAIAPHIDPAVDTYIVYGFGLGYYIEALHERIADTADVYVVIDNGNFFISALCARSFERLFNRTQTHYMLEIDGTTLAQLVQQLDSAAFKVVRIRSIWASNPSYFAELDVKINALMVRRRGNENTTRRFCLVWVANCLKNIPAITQSIDCFDTRNCLQGVPMLLVAAGPSLDSVVGDLGRWVRKVCIIAIDTACNALAKAGITPDIIVATDPQYWNSRHIDTRHYRDTILLFDPCVHPRVLHRQYRHTIAFATMVPIVKMVQQHIPLRLSIGAGGTVTSVGWEFARWAGAPTVYLAGADFGYPRATIHCQHCFFEARMQAMGTLLETHESLYYRYFCMSALERTRSNNGHPLLTDNRLSIYANWFEEHIAHYPTPHTIAIGGEGRRIARVPYRTSASLERLPDIQKKKRHCLQALRQLPTLDQKMDTMAMANIGKDMRRMGGAIHTILTHRNRSRTASTASTPREDPRRNAATAKNTATALRHSIANAPLSAIEKEVARSMCSRYIASPTTHERDAIERIIRRGNSNDNKQ